MDKEYCHERGTFFILTYIYIYCLYIKTHIHSCTHIYTYTYIHTYTHTPTPTLTPRHTYIHIHLYMKEILAKNELRKYLLAQDRERSKRLEHIAKQKEFIKKWECIYTHV